MNECQNTIKGTRFSPEETSITIPGSGDLTIPDSSGELTTVKQGYSDARLHLVIDCKNSLAYDFTIYKLRGQQDQDLPYLLLKRSTIQVITEKSISPSL
jgi:hypothetical protein